VEDVLIVDDPVFASNTAKAVQREWHITPSTTPTASGTDIVFQYNDDPLALPRETGLLYNTGENVQVWREVNLVSPYGNDWIAVNVAQVPTGSPDGIRTASITNWTQFSPFAISNISAPLPIKLLQFNAIKINSGLANLNWELAACCAATAKFEVERSTDGRTYAVFTTIPGSTTSRFYQLNDSRLSKGITYYRLKMTDEDGKITYSKVAVIINDNTGLLITSLAPNPAQDKTVVSITAAKPGTVSFEMVNLAGAVVKKWSAPIAGGTNTITIQTGDIAAGIYHIQATAADARTIFRLVKQ
jgi:hypothetical protein